MDMRKFSGTTYYKVDDVRDAPIEEEIADVKLGKWDKPDLYFKSGNVLSLNKTNCRTLERAYGRESEFWLAKTIKLFLGSIRYQGSDEEAVCVSPVSPSDDPDEADEPAPPASKPFNDEIPF